MMTSWYVIILQLLLKIALLLGRDVVGPGTKSSIGRKSKGMIDFDYLILLSSKKENVV
jgi:hypothetical protein